MRAGLLVACVGAGLLSSATPAHAAPPDAAARESRRHFQAAEAHFKAGAFDAALGEYQAGYDAKPLPGFLINIAQCQRRLGDLKAARTTYQKFVMVAPDSPLVPQAKAMVAELDKLLADLSNEPANANTNDAAATTREGDDSQTRKPADVEPAAAASAVTAVVPAEPPAATSAPVLVASPSPADESRAPTGRRWWLWGTIGAVVVGGAVTAFVLSAGGTTTVHEGSLGTLRR
jgi:hypothetical protein